MFSGGKNSTAYGRTNEGGAAVLLLGHEAMTRGGHGRLFLQGVEPW
jgi:hypothetical protein